MTYQDVASMVSEIGVPYAYYQFPDDTEQATPFVCFYFPDTDDVFADNINYQRINALNLELYTDDKDFEMEAQVESVLELHEMTYTKSESYIDSEKMYEVLYQMEVIING